MSEDIYRRNLRAARYSYRVARMRHQKAVAAVERVAFLVACGVIMALLIG